MHGLRTSWVAILTSGCTVIVPHIARADPIHDHCAIAAFTQPERMTTELEGPTLLRFLGFSLESGGDDLPPCTYETSDITRVTVTLTFTPDVPSVTAMIRGRSPGGPNPPPDPDQRYTFASGVATSLVWTAHTAGPAWHLGPGQRFGIDFYDVEGLENVSPPVSVTADLIFEGTTIFRVRRPFRNPIPGSL
jgi:hypothetical protein